MKPLSREAEIYGGVHRFVLKLLPALSDGTRETPDNGERTASEPLPLIESVHMSSVVSMGSSTESSTVGEEATQDIPRNVPPSGVFVGRTQELDRIRSALNSRYSLICISGLGGIGKTALALEAVSRCLAEAPQNSGWPAFAGFVWVSARARVVTLPDILSAVATVLDQPGIGTQSLSGQKNAIYRLFRLAKYLLILDNFESVHDADIYEFVRGIPEPSKVLITTRDSSTNDAFCVTLGGLGQEEFFELLGAEGDRLGFPTLRNDNRPELLTIYEATGGAPLAIKWAVGQLGQHGQNLDSVIKSLAEARGNIFEEIFDRSWSLLKPASQRLLSIMPIFATDALRAAIKAVCGIDDLSLDEALGQLVSLNLVDATDSLNEEVRRYSIHPLTRAFVQRKAALSSELLHRAHTHAARWFAEFSIEQTKNGRKTGVLGVELQNILKSMRWCHQNRVWEPIASCSIALREFLPDQGYWNEALELGNFGIEAAEALGDRYHVGRLCIIPVGWIYRYRGDLEAAQLWYERGMHAFVDVGDMDRAAWARLALANILLRSGRAEEARAVAEEVRDSGAGDTPVRKRVVYAASLIHLSEMAYYRGEYETTESLAREARGVSLETGYRNSTLSASYWLGMAHLRLGNLEEADRFLGESLQLNTTDNVRMGIALCQAALAELRRRQGHITVALECAESARDLYERLGMQRELAELQPLLELLRTQQEDTL